MPALNTPQNAPVQVVARLAPESHFAEMVRADRKCKVCSKPGNRKRKTNVCVQPAQESPIFVGMCASRPGTLELSSRSPRAVLTNS
ncbi:hypothetical protein RRG08_002925 [Elysia crispata]|uniref:Uncharacterized protein n=1 Tax=Elysia crispata TaxID=231223 RepID=A0AAE1APN2_9GAST|nr:hypothetical protein RRG08_002925 [Elysia crispata]